ncbi:hypothetical protein GBA52_025155 [Prunus armeniaca]|nr:hypothetical protein GBA52_025155 [Prunus armeniaca]
MRIPSGAICSRLAQRLPMCHSSLCASTLGASFSKACPGRHKNPKKKAASSQPKQCPRFSEPSTAFSSPDRLLKMLEKAQEGPRR